MGKSRGRTRSEDTEFIVFNGITYTRRPGKKYYKTNRWDKQRKKYYAEALHQAVWKLHRGPVPAGCDIHHKDGDYNNNDIGNLEPISRSDHAKLHDRFRDYNKTALAKQHRQRAIQIGWAKAVYKTYECDFCHNSFESRRALPPKFCPGTSCGHLFRYYQKRNAGVRPRS